MQGMPHKSARADKQRMRSPVISLRILACCAVPLLLVAPAAVSAKAPAGTCPDLGAPVMTITAVNYGAKKNPATGSSTDAVKRAQNTAALSRPVAFENTLSDLTDQAIANPGGGARAGAEGLLVRWASAGALIETDGKNKWGAQSNKYQEWLLTNLAISRLKLGRISTPAHTRTVDDWLRRIAQRVEAYNVLRGPERRTNLFAWGLLGVGVTAHVTGDAAMWKRANAMNEAMLGDIRADGTLPSELSRDNRAAKYTAFAAEPLAVFALVRNLHDGTIGRPVDPRLQRLLALVQVISNDAAPITKLTGVTQLKVGQQKWLNFFRRTQARAVSTIPYSYQEPRLGGSLRNLSVVLSGDA
jgi:hypothetical protein